MLVEKLLSFLNPEVVILAHDGETRLNAVLGVLGSVEGELHSLLLDPLRLGQGRGGIRVLEETEAAGKLLEVSATSAEFLLTREEP